MLLITGKNPGWGKRKPAKRGPISRLRLDLYRNAAAMGIDPQEITTFIPAMEGAGVARDIIRGAILTSHGSAFWDKQRLSTGDASELASSWRSSDFATDDSQDSLVFILTDVKFIKYAASKFICGQVGATSVGYDWGVYSSNFVYLKTNNGTVSTPTGTAFSTGKVFNQLGITYDGENLAALVNGEQKNSTAQTGTILRSNLLTIGSWNTNDIGVSVAQILALKSASIDIIKELNDTPYALLEKTADRSFFYIDQATGIAYQLLIDTRASLSTEIRNQTDTVARLSTMHQSVTDTWAEISSQYTAAFDSLAILSTDVIEQVDAKANISTEITEQVDTTATLSTQLQTLVDTQANLSTEITTLIDTLAELSSTGSYQLSVGTLAIISSQVQQTVDTQAALSSSISQQIDTTAQLSTTVGEQVDTRAALSTQISVQVDTLAQVASLYREVVATLAQITDGSEPHEVLELISKVTLQLEMISKVTTALELKSPIDLQ